MFQFLPRTATYGVLHSKSYHIYHHIYKALVDECSLLLEFEHFTFDLLVQCLEVVSPLFVAPPHCQLYHTPNWKGSCTLICH